MAGLTLSQAKGLFRSERLIYRQIEDTEADKKVYWSVFKGDGLEAIAGGSHLLVPPTTERYWEALKTFKSNSYVCAFICLENKANPSAEARPIGFVLCWKANFANRLRSTGESEIGVFMLEEYQGNGYGTEAVRWAVSWIFKNTMCTRAYLESFGYNQLAMRAWENIGFLYEGRTREATRYEGKNYDMAHYSILSHEWDVESSRLKAEAQQGREEELKRLVEERNARGQGR